MTGSSSLKQHRPNNHGHTNSFRRVVSIKHADKIFVAVALFILVEIGIFSSLYGNVVKRPKEVRNLQNGSAASSTEVFDDNHSVDLTTITMLPAAARVIGPSKSTTPETPDDETRGKKTITSTSSSTTSSSQSTKPRIVFLDPSETASSALPAYSSSQRQIEALGDLSCCDQDPLDYIQPQEKAFYEVCTPMADWQTTFYPTCNTLHELPMVEDDNQAYSDKTSNHTGSGNTVEVTLLNTQGSWRTVWKVSQHQEPQNVVLKTLKYTRKFNHESFQLQIVDSLAMERLTSSPYIADAYGFCGQSVLTEFAPKSGRDLIKNKHLHAWERVRIAYQLAQALSDMHSIDFPRATNASLTHNDINIANTITGGGDDGSVIKFNDFNIGVMMRWNPEQQQPCGYPVKFLAPLWRSPEEIVKTNTSVYVQPDKSDIYGLGNIIFQVLTTHQPWTWLEPGGRLSIEEVVAKKLVGELPHIPRKFYDHNKTAIHALYHATKACYAHRPENRPTAYQLAQALKMAMLWAKEGPAKNLDRVPELFQFHVQEPNASGEDDRSLAFGDNSTNQIAKERQRMGHHDVTPKPKAVPQLQLRRQHINDSIKG